MCSRMFRKLSMGAAAIGTSLVRTAVPPVKPVVKSPEMKLEDKNDLRNNLENCEKIHSYAWDKCYAMFTTLKGMSVMDRAEECRTKALEDFHKCTLEAAEIPDRLGRSVPP